MRLILTCSFQQSTGQFQQQRRFARSWFAKDEHFPIGVVIDLHDGALSRG